LTEGRSRFRPQWTDTLLASFAKKPNLSGTVQSELPSVDCQGFADSSSGIVEKEQEGSIARRKGCSRLYGSDDRTGLFRF